MKITGPLSEEEKLKSMAKLKFMAAIGNLLDKHLNTVRSFYNSISFIIHSLQKEEDHKRSIQASLTV